MNFPVRLSSLLPLCLLGSFFAAAEELPLPQGGLEMPLLTSEPFADEARFLKPTKSIKPPASAVASAQAVSQPQVNAPTVARLRRLILMPGGLPPENLREQMLASGHSHTPVTVVGMNAPAPVLSNLANFFGSDVNADTQKKLLDTVRQSLRSPASDKAAPRRVEVVGWLPNEGVMAVAVYPES